MNQNLILRIVGVILCIEALCMIPPLLLSVFGGGVDQRAFFVRAAYLRRRGSAALAHPRGQRAAPDARRLCLRGTVLDRAERVRRAAVFFQRQLQLYRRHFRDRLRPDDDRRVHLPVACVAAAGHPILARAHAVDGRHGYPRFDAGAAAQAQRGQREPDESGISRPHQHKAPPPHG